MKLKEEKTNILTLTWKFEKKIIIENKETNDSRKSRLDMNQTTQRSVEY